MIRTLRIFPLISIANFKSSNIMKKITLINPEIAQTIFKRWNWLDESTYLIKVEGTTNEIMCSASVCCANLLAENLSIGFGSIYSISLEDFGQEIVIEIKEIQNLGVIVIIQDIPWMLRVFRHGVKEEILQIGKRFPSLRIIDFGSAKNPNIQNLDSLMACEALQILNLDNCPGLQDISGLSSFTKLNTLWLDGFTNSGQFKFIASCRSLEKLSQNISQLRSIEHISDLSLLNILSITQNSNLTDLSPLANLSALTNLNLRYCENLTDLSPLSGLDVLANLDLSGCTYLTNLWPLSGLDALANLDLSGCDNLTDLSPLSNLSALTYLKLNGCEKITDLSPIAKLVALTRLSLFGLNITDLSPLAGLGMLTNLCLQGCEKLTDLSPLSSLVVLTNLNLGECQKLTDLSPLAELGVLTNLRLNTCDNLTDLSPLSNLSALTNLNLSGCENLTDLSPLSGLDALANLDLSCCEKLTDLSPLSSLVVLTNLNLGECQKLTDLSPLSGLDALANLDLSGCENLTDLSPLSNLSALTYLNLGRCEKLSDLSPISGLDALTNLRLYKCENLFRIQAISRLPQLKEIDLEYSPHIRDFEKLSNLPKIRKIEWIDPVACNMVLITSATADKDTIFIRDNISEWIKQLILAKEAKEYSLKILNCLNVLMPISYREYLLDSAIKMRNRGLQSEEQNDLDAYTWETWCKLALGLDKADAISCMQSALHDLDIERETEIVLAPVILAFAELIEKNPEEKEFLLAWVQGQLELLINHSEEQRQIAPSAAVFFASLNKKDEVLFWLQKATDAKTPLWRDRVLHALIKHYAKKENFTEARQLLDEMEHQEEKDHAIATLALAMAASYPIEAGFLLDEIKETKISNESASKLLHQASMLSTPQSIYQLILHLQSHPDELALTLETIIEKDVVGNIANSVKRLFMQTTLSGPSAAILLELCKHPAIADFVKPRALEKYKRELQERANQELNQSVPYLIAEMKNASLLEENEAQELTALMQRK
jgi:pentatricopeptide repeat protein